MIVLLAVAAYANSFPGHFFWDDIILVKGNPLVNELDLPRIFSSGYWNNADSGFFRPLTILSLAVNRALLGPAPWSYHVVNVLLHASVSALLYLVVRQMRLGGQAALLAGAIFALHPIHTEVVNEIVGRGDLLAALFFFLALLLALDDHWRGWRAGAAALCYLAALLSKEHAVTLLAVLPVVDLFRGRDSSGWKERWPLYAGLGAITVGWLCYRQWGVDRGATFVPLIDPFLAPHFSMSYGERILTALKVQFLYVGKQLLPVGLQAVYSGKAVSEPVRMFSWAAAAVIAGTSAMVFAVWRGWRERSVVALALVLYCLCSSATSNVIIPIRVLMAERYVYLASAWFSLACALLICQAARSFAWYRPLVALTLTYLMLLGTLLVWRNLDFSSPVRLWRADVEKDPSNIVAWMALADAYSLENKPREEGAAHLKALSLAPDSPEVLIRYAAFLSKEKRDQESMDFASRGIVQPSNLRDQGYLILAKGYLRFGQPDEALKWLEKVVDPRLTDNYWDLKGEALQAKGDLRGAAECYRKIKLSPKETDAFSRWGRLLVKLGEYAEAERILRYDLAEVPNAASFNALGVALASQGRIREAREMFGKAMELAPNFSEYRLNFERAAAQLERIPETNTHP